MSMSTTKRQIAELLPDQGIWDEEAYLWLSDRTNRLVELAHGRLEVLPMPTERHQIILAALYEIFRLAVPNGKVLFAPLRLRLAPGRIREPDLLLLLDRNDARRNDKYWLGADLVLEVISPSNREHDLVTKFHEFAGAGISEYWVVDPDRDFIQVFYLADSADHYVEHCRAGRGDSATSRLIPELRVDVSEVLDAN